MVTVSIIIPLYNEAKTVRELLDRVWAQDIPRARKELIIVESHSTDGTREIVQQFTQEINAQTPGSVKLLLQDAPRGKGFAVRAAFRVTTGDLILIQDGDLEYDVQEYPSLIAPILEGKANFVLGSRHLSAGSWKIRKFENSPIRSSFLNLGGIFFHTFFNVLYGVSLTDPTTMFKVFRRSSLEGLHFVSNRFDFDFELVAKLIRSGNVPIEVPVSYSSRGFAEGKKIRVLRDPLTWVVAILRFRFSALRSAERESSTIALAPAEG